MPPSCFFYFTRYNIKVSQWKEFFFLSVIIYACDIHIHSYVHLQLSNVFLSFQIYIYIFIQLASFFLRKKPNTLLPYFHLYILFERKFQGKEKYELVMCTQIDMYPFLNISQNICTFLPNQRNQTFSRFPSKS